MSADSGGTATTAVRPVDDGRQVLVETPSYRVTWHRDDDTVQIADGAGRLVATAPLQPAVPVADEAGARCCSPGTVDTVTVAGDRLLVTYRDVNGGARLRVELRFESEHFWIEPVRYLDPAGRHVVALHHFAHAAADPVPALHCTYLIQPGLSMSGALSPVLPTELGLDVTSWLGRGSMGPDSEVLQQWGLPVHYFCGVSREAGHNARGSLTGGQSDAFCCGLAELPDADLMMHLRGGALSPVFNLRADLWRHRGATSELTLGAQMVWAFGADYRAAIRRYYRILIDAGLATPPDPPQYRRETLAAAQFNTWGAQCAAERTARRFDQDVLEGIYDGMRASGLRPGMFVIDDKWEGRYGVLRHDERRFPRFEQFLARVRADGHRVGLWAAFLRTNDPTAVGLTDRHLMCDRDGVPIEKNNDFAREPYYLLDPSQAEVRAVLHELIGEFVRRYDPDLVKFDFGYELPSLSVGRPGDLAHSGELLLRCALDVIVPSLRAAKPNIAVMYYSLSPLLLQYVDQHCHDDMYLCVDEYELENNRRLFFSSLLGELGLSVYGSGGYAWRGMREIWFDTAIAGPVGSLNAFTGDEHDDLPMVTDVATYNGLSALTRPVRPCRIEPVSPVSVSSTYGARSRSWLRYEDGEVVAAAVRAGDAAPVMQEAGMRLDAPAVVASLTRAGLAGAARIGVVPFGPGTLHLERKGVSSAHVVQHRLGVAPQEYPVDVADDHLAVDLPADSADAPLEWLEITVETTREGERP